MFGALKCGFRSMASLMLVRNVVDELQPKRTLAASRGFLAAARLSCYNKDWIDWIGLGEKVKNPENVKCVRIIKCVKVRALFVNIKCVSHVRNNYEYQSRCAMLVRI